MSFKLASAILRGHWFIEPAYAQAQLPLILSMLKNEAQLDPLQIDKTANHANSVNLPGRVAFSGSQSTGVFCVNPYTSLDRLPYNSIAMIDIEGPIMKYGGYCSYGTVDQNDLLIRMGNSDRVKGVLLNIDSPGGQVDGTGTFAETIRAVSKIKPVIAVIQDGMAASCAMWLAAAAQEIYVTRAKDQVGSIGAYCRFIDYAGYFEQNGIKVIDIYAPQSTDKNKPYRDALKGDAALIESELKFLVEEFKKDVLSFRGNRLNTAKEDPFTGKLYFAKEAIKIGLIDGIKPMSSVIKRMEELIALRA
jgi:ClpP class serine protease